MSFVWFVLIGITAGWLAGQLVKGGGFGLVGDLVVGIVGALLGGFVVLGNAELKRCFSRGRVPTLAAGAALIAASIAAPGAPGVALRGVGAWILALGVFAFALHALGRLPTPPMALREMGLPFFILSRPVVVVVGYLLRDTAVRAGLRAAIVIALSLVCLVGLTLAVRRSNLLRFLFGLPPPERL